MEEAACVGVEKEQLGYAGFERICCWLKFFLDQYIVGLIVFFFAIYYNCWLNCTFF